MRLFSVGLLSVVALSMVVSVAANAQTPHRKKKGMVDEMSGQGYGVAGCGLGSIAFGSQPGPIQIVAATLNGTGGQVFAITTGTSNCDLGGSGMQAAAFIDTNHETVVKDMARGKGETVSSLAYLFRCSDQQLFGDKMRQNYNQILENGISSYETTRRIQKAIETNPELKQSCQPHQLG